MRKSYRSVGGFSLIEVMVVAGISAAMAAATGSVILNMVKQTQSVTAKSEFNELVNLLGATLSNNVQCTSVFLKGKTSVLSAGKQTVLNSAISETAPQNVSFMIGQTEYGEGVRFNGGVIQKVQLVSKAEASGRRPGEFLVRLRVDATRQTGNQTIGAPLRSELEFGVTLSTMANQVVPNPVSNLPAGVTDLESHPGSISVPQVNTIIGCGGMFNNSWIASKPSPSPYPQGAQEVASLQAVSAISFPGWVAVNKGAGGVPQTPLDVLGSVKAKAFLYDSDERLKENVREIPSALSRVLGLRGVIYDWKDKRAGWKSEDQLGLLAQEVERIFPEAVLTDPGTGMKSVAYGNLIAPLIEAIKSQQELIERQDREIKELRQTVFKKHGR